MVTDGTKDPLLMDSIKIKQEKLTPPSTPNINSSAAGFNITDDLLDNILGERKPAAEPIKSSNEILADLFKVFNAAPPTLDEDGSTKDSTHKKKKQKKEKKVKKEKKRSRENSETKTTGDEHKVKKRKAKKSKKHDGAECDIETKRHKRHKKSKEPAIKTDKHDVVIKQERIEEANKRTASGNAVESKSHDEDKSKKDKQPPILIQVSVTKDNDGIGKRKIVIKSLVDSTVYQHTLKEVDAKQKEKEREKLKEEEREKEKDRDREKAKERARDRERRKHSSRSSKSKEKEHRSRARSHSSSLSLSDEETYLREREVRERYKVSIRISGFIRNLK